MSTLLPFLYQTRTILRVPGLHGPIATVLRRSLHATAVCRTQGDNDIPFATDLPSEDAENVSLDDKSRARSTITPAEQHIFDRIFADIAARGRRPYGSPSPSSKTQRAANLIMSAAAADAGQQPRDKIVSPSQFAVASRGSTEALMQFPPALRPAARTVLGLLEEQDKLDDEAAYQNTARRNEEAVDDEWQPSKNAQTRMIEVDAKRHPEQKRIEELMHMAKSDFELWDIMEEEVFTFPDKLGIRKQIVEETDTKSKSRKTKKFDDRLVEATPTAPEKLDLYVYGPLYPSSLFLGLRLLDTAFAAPSRLALNVLPRVKELGLESFVLGISTPFYNELLRIYWQRYGDLSKMLGLLEEMRHSGMYFDEGTSSVLHEALGQTSALAKGTHGSFASALMTMPEYEQSQRSRIGHWQRAVDLSIKQRDQDNNYQ